HRRPQLCQRAEAGQRIRAVQKTRQRRLARAQPRAAGDPPDPEREGQERGTDGPQRNGGNAKERREQVAGGEQAEAARQGGGGVDAIGDTEQGGAVHGFLPGTGVRRGGCTGRRFRSLPCEVMEPATRRSIVASREVAMNGNTSVVGSLLREWRGLRRMSQLDLALVAEISP